MNHGGDWWGCGRFSWRLSRSNVVAFSREEREKAAG